MEYRNPELPEGINTGKEHPLKEFALLLLGVFGGAALLLLALAYFAQALAGYIPFSAERRLAAQFAPDKPADSPLQRYLQQLADGLARAEGLPPGMTISVHYLDDDTVNAFATLGGQVFIFRGLLRRVRSENALAMVMAHEIAHVKNRDPLRSMGRGVVIAAALAVIDASLGTRLAGDALGQAGLLTQLRFSRAQEGAADQAALAALAARYGGTAGFEGLFRILAAAHPGKGPPGSGIYRSHPQIAARVAALEHQARSHGWSRGRVTPLPPAFPAWLKAAAKAGPESAGTRP